MDHAADPWPVRQRCLWIALAAAALALNGPGMLRALRPSAPFPLDFYQEWASARNFRNGLPIYTLHEATAPLYLGHDLDVSDPCIVEVNAHPPTSVLLGLPFAGLRYWDAHFAWNLVSLLALVISGGLIVSQLPIRSRCWAMLPIGALLLGDPLRLQLYLGQFNGLLLLLLTIMWVADRSGRSHMAGACLGLAVAIKIFPGFLILYFLVRRQWDVVAFGLAWLAVALGLTGLVLGPDAYAGYVAEALPRLGEWRSAWRNNSLPGLWAKLFDPGTKGLNVVPFVCSPTVRLAATGASFLGLVSILVRTIRGARSRMEQDGAFGLTMLGMLLLSPISWDHYTLLLFLPLGWLWLSLAPGSPGRGMLALAAALLWLPVEKIWALFGIPVAPDGQLLAGPWFALTALSVQLFAILGLFFLMLVALRKMRPAVAAGEAPEASAWSATVEPLRPAA